MASGEIRLSTTMLRRMPVLAQSQNLTQSAGNAAQAPFPGSCDANCQSLQITVPGHYMDADPGPPTFYGPNYALIGSNPQFKGYGPAINFIGRYTVYVTGGFLGSGPMGAGASIVSSIVSPYIMPGSAPACVLCGMTIFSDGSNYAADIAGTLSDKEIPMETNGLGAGLGTALEEGQQGLEMAAEAGYESSYYPSYY
jgi:hypothetical protein